MGSASFMYRFCTASERSAFKTNEPPSTDPKFFTGPALTYYGRWTYKFEEAARHGAIAALIIHTEPTASYGWEVVRSSWGTEEQQVRLAEGEPALGFAGWMTKPMGDRIAATINMTADQMVAEADKKGFMARELPLRFTEAIDMCAMRSGASETDAYLAEWRKADPVPVGDDLDAEADQAVEDIETRYTRERLVALVKAGGRENG